MLDGGRGSEKVKNRRRRRVTKDDIILAEAITKDPINYQDGDYAPYYWCDYCSAELHGYGANISDFTHDPDCPVIVAQKVLTKAEGGGINGPH